MIKNIFKTFKKGFTLVELLVVIAVLGVLSAGLYAAIDPIDKLAYANDAKVSSDIGVIASAENNYATAHNSCYINSAAGLTSNGETPSDVVAPANYAAYIWTPTASVGCPAPEAASLVVVGTRKSKRYTGGAKTFLRWESIGNKTCERSANNIACP